MAATMQLEIPARSVYVGVVRLALVSVARLAGLDEARVEDLRIAVSEACTNAVIANETDDADDPVRVSWTEEADRIVVEIIGKGSNHKPDPEDSVVGSNRFEMSIALMESLVDECTFEPLAEGGTTTRLVIEL